MAEVDLGNKKETLSLLFLKAELSKIQRRDFLSLKQRKTKGNQGKSDEVKKLLQN